MYYTKQLNWEFVNGVRETLINGFNEYQGSDVEQMFQDNFNSDPYIIGYYQAEQELIKAGGVFKCINIVKEWEETNFGEFKTKINAESICSMLAYIVAEELLNKIGADFDDEITEETAAEFIERLENL